MASQETMKDVNLYYLGGLPEDVSVVYVASCALRVASG